ncbi:MAG: hypothetical protein V3V78_01260 [Candidatus Woesearchaeota archaeon]
MNKKVVLLLIISLFILGCAQEAQKECTTEADCDDGKINTKDSCIAGKCLHSLKSCDGIQGSICESGKNCTEEYETLDEKDCCVGDCIEVQASDTCSELNGYICTSSNSCPKEVIEASDSYACCPVNCLENTAYFINEEINGYVPIASGENTPEIFFEDEFDKGYQLTYEKDGDLVEVSVWIFKYREYVNENVEDYLEENAASKDVSFMKDTHKKYDVVGLRDIGSDSAEYIWNHGFKVIHISKSEGVFFLKAYLDKYESDLNTTYFE